MKRDYYYTIVIGWAESITIVKAMSLKHLGRKGFVNEKGEGVDIARHKTQEDAVSYCKKYYPYPKEKIKYWI